MDTTHAHALVAALSSQGDELLAEWVEAQIAASPLRRGVIDRRELEAQAQQFLNALAAAVQREPATVGEDPAVRRILEDLSTTRARLGFTAEETATFVFSLKQPIFARLSRQLAADPKALAAASWQTGLLFDRLGLYTMEVFQRGREEVIARQQEEVLELSTPVIALWDGILALPVIGTLDSARTQIVMESLLQRIVATGSGIAIIDITGVPTVDTVTAQHLLKTIAAARLMGADCIISGIRPQIAQTIVHLGVDLGDVQTKATLADAFAMALRRLNLTVQKVQRRKPSPADDEPDQGQAD
jgi:rsbT co-antagonist protein RsbR